jgi:hypothetical protein
LARLPSRRQRDADDAAVKPFPRVMIDRCGKVLKVAPRAAATSPFGVGAASGASDFAQPPLAKEIEESTAALGGLLGTGLMRRHVGEVDANHVGDRNLGYVALAARRSVLAGDVGGEGGLSLWTIALAEASATLASAVSDDPYCGVDSIVARAGRPEPKVGASGLARHRPNIL